MAIELILSYALVINIISFVTMYHDKQKARNSQWRVPERNFFLLAIAGGSLGIFFGMRLFRHKTKHLSFKVVIPVIFFIQIVLLSYYL